MATSIGKPYDECDTWVGPDGVCPVCHNSLLEYNGTTRVECPICGIWGDLKFEGESVKVEFSEQEKNRARNAIAGIYEHYKEIQNMITVCVPKMIEHKEELEEQMKNTKISRKPLTAKNYFVFGLGNFASQLSWTMVSTYLSLFYTDVYGLGTGAVALLMLIAKIWDGINDPMMGTLME